MTNGQTMYTLPGGALHSARLLHTRIGIGGVAEMAIASDTETGRGQAAKNDRLSYRSSRWRRVRHP